MGVVIDLMAWLRGKAPPLNVATLEAMTEKDSRAALEALLKLPKEEQQKLLLEVKFKTHSRLTAEQMAQNLRNLSTRPYEVWTYENSNIPEPNNHRTVGTYEGRDAALDAARQVIDSFIAEQAGHPPAEIRELFLCWGDVPVVWAVGGEQLEEWQPYEYLDRRLARMKEAEQLAAMPKEG